MSEPMKLLPKQAQDFETIFQKNKQNPSFMCRFHPTDGFHEIGCPHREWSNKKLYDALITAKASHEAYVHTALPRPDPLGELRREVEECLERKKLGTLELLRKNDIVFKRDLTKVKDRSDEAAWWEKVAFSLYSEIAEIDSSIRNVFENAADRAGIEPKPDPLEGVEKVKRIVQLIWQLDDYCVGQLKKLLGHYVDSAHNLKGYDEHEQIEFCGSLIQNIEYDLKNYVDQLDEHKESKK